MPDNRPRGRDKNVIGGGNGVNRRGGGLGTGPVGRGGKIGGGSRPGNSGSKPSSYSGGGYGGGSLGGGFSKGKIILAIIVVIIVVATGGSGSLMNILFSGSSYEDQGSYTTGSGYGNTGSTGSAWVSSPGQLDTSVASVARDKYTTILGGSRDEVTIMVYLCGTDLESKSGMATADLKEMEAAKYSDNVNLIVYTGGCKEWKNNTISNRKNQIYQVKNGKLICLENDMGDDSMTRPATLTKFIQYCTQNFPANRNELILWDHGGGSITGFGYDEKNSSSGSMNLAGIETALKNAGTTFDFIGFDACLMATMENALMLSKYADYMIASEETEPGVGWYYTDWLTALGRNTSMSTIEIGKNIVDDFVDVCAKRCNGQKTTLSVVDLAELQETVPSKLTNFAIGTNQLIQNEQYRQVSDARYNAREFAQSSKIDQVDLVHLAQNMNTSEGRELCNAVKGAVKYNRTSANMTNANGIAIYFPYKKMSKVDKAVSEYRQMGMDSEYTRCIQEFASVEVGGQVAAGGDSGVGSLVGSLFGNVFGGELNIDGLGVSAMDFLSGRAMDSTATANYVANNSFDANNLVWVKDADGRQKIKLSEEQWSMVHGLDLNVYYDDGTGFVDLGYDNVFEFDDAGNLIGEYDNTWISINRQPVAYYHLDTVEEGSHYAITGYVPAMLNGERVELILVFDDANPNGYIAGARAVYVNGETETVAKSLTEVKSGDTLDFLCDYYTYGGSYQDSYYLGDTMVLGDEVVIGNVDIGDGKTKVMYRFTDIYEQNYWTPALTK